MTARSLVVIGSRVPAAAGQDDMIYAARPDAGAVVHTHAESAVVFGATGEPLRPLGKRNAILLRHPGLVTVGPAVLTAIFLEKACRTQLAATPVSWSSDEEAPAKRARCYSPAQLAAAWDHLVRTVVVD